MSIKANKIVVTNKDGAKLRPIEAPKPDKPKFNPTESIDYKPVTKQADNNETNNELFVKKRSKFLDDMTKS
jgi:hypothetical protein